MKLVDTRRTATVAFLLALSVVMLPAATAGAEQENPFLGHWVGNDPAPPVSDGSVNRLSVGGGKNHVFYHEDLLSACDQFTGDPLQGFFSGFATIDGDTLTVNTTIYCILPGVGVVPTEKFLQPFDAMFVDNGDGTLTDGFTCYHRPGRDEDCQD